MWGGCPISVDIKHQLLPEALKGFKAFVALVVRPTVNDARKYSIVNATNVAK